MTENRTTRRSRSYWQSVRVTDADHESLRAWFAPLADGMTPYKADILCDVETDREKKLRAFMRDQQGRCFVLTRSRGKRDTVISMKPIVQEAP